MIGSWFALGSVWTWEVVAADGTVVANGVAADEAAAGWECRLAIFVADQEAGGSTGPWTGASAGRWTGRWTGPEATEVALPSDGAKLAGRWSASRSWVAA